MLILEKLKGFFPKDFSHQERYTDLMTELKQLFMKLKNLKFKKTFIKSINQAY